MSIFQNLENALFVESHEIIGLYKNFIWLNIKQIYRKHFSTNLLVIWHEEVTGESIPFFPHTYIDLPLCG